MGPFRSSTRVGGGGSRRLMFKLPSSVSLETGKIGRRPMKIDRRINHLSRPCIDFNKTKLDKVLISRAN